MGLNISFKGYAHDEDDNKIDCKFQVYFARQDVWNNVRDTDKNYYSCNAGDDDALTQDGTVKKGDVILLTFWQGDGSGGATADNRDGLFDRFSVHKIIHDGETDEYVVEAMLKPKTAPNISWYLNSVRTINKTVRTYNYTNDKLTWTYDDNTFYHTKKVGTYEVFPKVGELTSVFDWTDDEDDVDGYEDTNNHSYTVIGDYKPKIKVTNAWDLSSENEKDLRIKYNRPIGALTFDPNGTTNQVHTTEDSTSEANITDIDERITEIEHHWIVRDRDNGDEISNATVDTNTTLDYSFTKTIEVLQKHYSKQIIKWNDGYDDIITNYERELVITNWIPLVNFKYKFVSETKIKFTPDCSDLDGDVVNYKWDLHSLIPFKNGEYVLSLNTTNDDDAVVEIEFETPGHYKMVLTATDDYGGSAAFVTEFDVTGESDCAGTDLMENDLCFIIPEKYKF